MFHHLHLLFLHFLLLLQNVIYVLTTPSLKQERRYILGKAKDMKNRLSTYNKSDEHEVIYMKECSSEKTMGLVESLIFNKLKEYREQANRERFILPEDKTIGLFTDIICSCVDYLG